MNMIKGNKSISAVWNLLRYAYAIVLALVGFDKIFGTNLIVNWSQYLNPIVSNIIPVGTFFIIVGIVEVAVAVLLVTRYTELGAYLSFVWLVLISLNLLSVGHVDVAARDLLLAVGALALAWLTSIVKSQASPAIEA